MARVETSKDGLAGKVALITGAASGIGRATALAFARAGASIAIADICERPVGIGASTADVIQQWGGRALFVETDVAQKTQVRDLISRVLQEFGRINILINNAGFGHTSLVDYIPDEVLRRLVDVNFYGVVYGVQAVLPVMRSQGGGHIINISSGAALMGLPYASIYAATKAAIMRFSEAIRYELEDDHIYVSVIFPDFTSTNLALEVTPDSDAPTRTIRSLNSEGVREYGSPPAKLQSSEEVAQAVLDCALHPRAEVYLSHRIRFNGLVRCLFPAAIEREARLMKTSLQQFLAKVSRDEDRAGKT